MITTLAPILSTLSVKLKEKTADVSTDRISAAISAIRLLLSEHKFSWARKSFTLDVDVGVQEYDLVTEATDYCETWGIYEVYVGGVKIDPIPYENRNNTDNTNWYLTPDNKSIGFTSDILGTESIVIWYYATIPTASEPATSAVTLNLSIPENVKEAIVYAAKAIVHESKRQRNDARNSWLIYQTEKEKAVQSSASNKAKGLPKFIPNVLSYTGFRRRYTVV